MSRRQIRDIIFRLLFRAEFIDGDKMEEQCAFFFASEEGEAARSEADYIEEKLFKIMGRLPELDKRLAKKIEAWDMDRVGKVDLAILRLAVYEMQYDEAIPESVAINEAVELAKKYGQENSRQFVNGVLSKLAET